MPGTGTVTVGICAGCKRQEILTHGAYCTACYRFWNYYGGTKAR